MEKLLAAALVAALLVPNAALARGHSGPAPADEYFGPYKESILGIRNHLNDLERKPDGELQGSVRGIDNEETAIEDWQAQYPQDSWIPHYLDRCVHLYARSHSLSDRHANHALALLQSNYSRSGYARDAFAVASASGHTVVAHVATHSSSHATHHATVAHTTTAKKHHCALGFIGRCKSS